jgi:hypothetical protein
LDLENTTVEKLKTIVMKLVMIKAQVSGVVMQLVKNTVEKQRLLQMLKD